MNTPYKIASITLAVIAVTGLAIIIPYMDASAQVFDGNGKKTIKIGTLLTDSGAHQDRLKAMNLAMDDFNSMSEDYALELVNYQINPNDEDSDSHADSRTGTQIKKAFTEDNITYFVGPMGSTDTRSAIEQLAVLMPANTNTDFVVISPASTDPRLRIDDNVFRMVIDDSQQSVVLADRLSSEGKTHVVMIGLNNSDSGHQDERDNWSEGLEIEFVKNFDNDVSYHFTLARGLESTNAAYDRLASDLDEAVSGLVSQHGASKVAVVAMVYAPDISNIVQAINSNTALESADDVKWYGPDGIAFRDEVTNDEDNPNVGRFLAKVGFAASQYAGSTNEVRANVESRLVSTGLTSSTPSSIYLYSSYDAVRLLANAIAERDRGNDEKTVKQLLHELADGPVGTGALGDYGFNEGGDLDEPFVFRFGVVTLDQNGDPTWSDVGSKKIIKIGTLLTDSGTHQDRLKAMNLAMNDFNSMSEDYALELVNYQINPNGEDSDSHADSRTGTQINKAFTEDGITYFVGPMGSTDTRSAKAQLDDILIPANTNTDFVVISPASTDPRLRIDDNVFRMVIDDSQQSVVLADRLNSEGKTHVIMIGLNNSGSGHQDERDNWSEGLEIEFVKNFDNDVSYHFTLARGLESTNAAYDRLASDLDEAVSGLVSQHGAGKVAVVAMMYAPDISNIVQAINDNTALESADDVQWYGPDGIAFRDEVTKGNPDVGRFLAKVGFAASQYAGSTNEVRANVESRLVSTGGFTSSTSSIYLYSSYDAVRLLANAIAERDRGNDEKTVKQLLHELADGPVGTGALGDYGFNEGGDLDEPFVFRFGVVTLDQNGAPAWQVAMMMSEPKICR